MAEKPTGFIGRLFGKKDAPNTPEPVAEEERVHQEEPASPNIPETAPGEIDALSSLKEPEAISPVVDLEREPASEPGEADTPDPTPLASQSGNEPEKKASWFKRLTSGLTRSSQSLTSGISAIFTKRKLDDETLEELEDILVQADLGIDTAMAITESLAKDRFDKMIETTEVKAVMAAEIEKVLQPVAKPLQLQALDRPQVILMVGVNGSGKTTTIGKLASKFAQEGRSVMLAAGDTFRAAAIEQLKIWAQRTNSKIVARDQGSDAAGLAYDAMQTAKDEAVDVLLIDTAGRLQNKAELMAELEKVIRVIRKHDETAPHHVLLTLDATTGQNAMNQVEVFEKTAGVTGLVMTKLDGTARGGILVAISGKYGIPVHYIGVGEGVDDLESFAARDFAHAIAGANDELEKV